MSAPDPVVERHASWLELFFDLVTVAGIGMLAHLLVEHHTGEGVVVYVIAFAALWLIWACFTIYANIAGEATRTAMMLAGMGVLGVMTAAIPEITGEHARAFAIAYVVGRMLAAQPWQRTTVVVDLPVVQAGVSVLPWIVSWWFEGPTQHVLWAVGIALDLMLLLTTTRERLLAETQERLDRVLRARSRPHHGPQHGPQRGTRRDADLPTTVAAADADVPHLGERLGLFVLIVLGEGLVQIIDGASEAAWDRQLALTGAGAFALMAALWAVAVRWGYAGVALLPEGGLSARLSWAVHLPATLALATVAAVLGGLVADPTEAVADHTRWVLVSAFAGYGLLSTVVQVGLATVASDAAARRTTLLRGVRVAAPAAVAAVVVAAVPDLAAETVVWVLAAGVLGTVVADVRRVRT